MEEDRRGRIEEFNLEQLAVQNMRQKDLKAMWRTAVTVAVVLVALATSLSWGGDDSNPRRAYKTKYLTIHTDIDEKVAKELLANLDKIFGQLIDYFGAKPETSGTGFVVVDLDQFAEIPPDAAAKIKREEGITHTERSSYLDEKGKISEVESRTVTFYSCGKPNIALHEAVHAFCGLTFKDNGPPWYREGIAEVGQYWQGTSQEVHANEEVLRYLKRRFKSDPPSLLEITDERRMPLATGEEYAVAWSLTHLLMHHPRYTKAIHALGLKYMHQEEVSFQETFAQKLEEIDFEWRRFVEDMEPGYRVDLCYWEWKPAKPVARKGARCRIEAARGWQPAGVKLEKDQEYELKFTGKWRLAKSKRGGGGVLKKIVRMGKCKGPYWA